ncbi:MAG TPA: beta-L-arabinofuranosidase domain-containing protein [Candidatus Dormibacteraeota bacterium]|nr:beta-L-arabinofuranosidase domain-containing protein [Candidatus Dormibacteraeota bacterium]
MARMSPEMSESRSQEAAVAFRELPPGAIRPEGWLAGQLRLQAEGQTGRLEEIWPEVGPDSGWLGGAGESWERGPYYLDGLVPLAHALDDPGLKSRARPWIEWMLASQTDDGWFGPRGDDWWPRMVALKVLTAHADATGDERVRRFLAAYFRHQLRHLPDRPLQGWGRARGADNALSVWWLYERAGDAWLLELIDLILAQTEDWGDYLTRDLITGKARLFRHLTHGPNVAMGLKTDALRYLRAGGGVWRARTEAAFANLDRWHGQAHGWFSGDEWLGGREATAGIETCQVVELMFTLEQLARIFGGGVYGDRLESLAFNLLPASCDPRMRSHQYLQQANQVRVSVGRRDWSYSSDDANLFGLEPHFGCCTANLHQGWPKFVRSLWMSAGEGLAAVAYAPCAVAARAGGASVRLKIQTDYPFWPEIDIRVGVDRPAAFPIRLRIPGWCEDAEITVGGARIDVWPVDGYVTVEREWSDGDAIRLVLPATPRLIRRERQAVSVRYGPLTMVAGAGENWIPVPGAPGLGEWEVHPRTSWNQGLVADDPHRWPVVTSPVGPIPFLLDTAPIRIRAPGALIPGWRLDGVQAGQVPDGPVLGCPVRHQVTLVPYGSARIRLTEMPTVAGPAPGD